MACPQESQIRRLFKSLTIFAVEVTQISKQLYIGSCSVYTGELFKKLPGASNSNCSTLLTLHLFNLYIPLLPPQFHEGSDLFLMSSRLLPSGSEIHSIFKYATSQVIIHKLWSQIKNSHFLSFKSISIIMYDYLENFFLNNITSDFPIIIHP